MLAGDKPQKEPCVLLRLAVEDEVEPQVAKARIELQRTRKSVGQSGAICLVEWVEAGGKGVCRLDFIEPPGCEGGEPMPCTQGAKETFPCLLGVN